VILFTLQLDQAFFPLLFTSGVGLAVMLAERDHWLAAVATGVFLYSAVFFTFSLLPLGLFLAIYLGLVTAAAPRVEPRRWFRLGRTGLLALAGLVGTHLVIRVAFQIDLLARFPRAMAAHQAAKGFVTDLPGIAPAWMVNNAEFILWLGFPIALLVVIQLIESARAVWQRRLRGVDLLALSTLATYLALNIFGDTRAEVARLWLFLLPVLAIFAANQLKRLPFARSTNTLLLVGAQLIAAYLIFLYQFPWQ
jgi:hypothetical protein